MPQAKTKSISPGISAKPRGDAVAIPAMDHVKVFHCMAKARAMEERMIKMAKSSDSHFWIGGPGEEAFNVPLGLLTHKGQGPAYDYLHLHYRSSGVMIALGMDIKDGIRQAASVATDPFSGGRHFTHHYAYPRWNVMPVTSTIEVQYAFAPGNALANKRHSRDAITIVTGGDAGTAEGDFATCLNWATRPGEELPILIVIVNNGWGISTPFIQVQGAEILARRGEAFGIPWATVDGNDPVASWEAIFRAMDYVRRQRKPYCLEAYVSRLHGHSSSSGAGRVEGEPDPLLLYEERLVREKILSGEECKAIQKQYADEAFEALKAVRQEPRPDPKTLFRHFYKEEDGKI